VFAKMQLEMCEELTPGGTGPPCFHPNEGSNPEGTIGFGTQPA
jgi:hypothetical protein